MAQQNIDASDEGENMAETGDIPTRNGYVTGRDGESVKVSHLAAGETFTLDGERFEVVDLVTDAVVVRELGEVEDEEGEGDRR